MSKKSIIFINLIGTILVISLFLYTIRGEFNIKTNPKDKIEKSISKIDKERDKTISSLKIINNPKKDINYKDNKKKPQSKRQDYILRDYKSVYRRYQERVLQNKNPNITKIPPKKASVKSTIEVGKAIKKEDNNTKNSIDINDTNHKEEKNNNTYYPNAWGVDWPPSDNNKEKEDINSSNLVENKTIEDIIESVGGDLGNLVLIRIFKAEKRLELWMSITGEYKLLKSYSLTSYSGRLGPKLSKDDNQAPEGYYSISENGLILDAFGHYKARLLFPNKFDREHNITSGEASIHDEAIKDDGFALKDTDMQEIYEVLNASFVNGYKYIPVYIYPFEMTQDNLNKLQYSQWFDFWKNIKEGYDYFMKSYRTPTIRVIDGKYVFHVL